MRYLLLALLLSGCTIPVQLQPTVAEQQEVVAAVNAQAKVIEHLKAIVANYAEKFKELQDKGILPKPKEEPKNETK